ncbi:MAG: hypothetical protein RLZZ343_1280 [Actinomycetota bacterium]
MHDVRSHVTFGLSNLLILKESFCSLPRLLKRQYPIGANRQWLSSGNTSTSSNSPLDSSPMSNQNQQQQSSTTDLELPTHPVVETLKILYSKTTIALSFGSCLKIYDQTDRVPLHET